MNDEIKPALTPEEWETRECVRGEPGGPLGSLHNERHISADEESLYLSDSFETVSAQAPHRQALAALALHGQLFGFTWEDVDALRDAIDALNNEWGELIPGTEFGMIPSLRSLADRIAVLLPPREGMDGG
jgi:hypothetical protein